MKVTGFLVTLAIGCFLEGHGAEFAEVEASPVVTTTNEAESSATTSDGTAEDVKSTPYSGFWSGVVTSVSLTMITEFGDRTFFIAALMALKYGKFAVFMGASAALVSQTVFSVGFGRLLHLIPASSTRSLKSVPIDDYAAAILLFAFAMIHLRDAFTDDGEASGDSTPSEVVEARETVNELQYMKLNSRPELKSVLWETFWAIFIAELGDKSMISTVALATAQNPYGVFFGASCSHVLLTLFAVVAGSALQGYISTRIANGVGGLLFLAYAVLTGIEGLARQGFPLWTSGVSMLSATFTGSVATILGSANQQSRSFFGFLS